MDEPQAMTTSDGPGRGADWDRAFAAVLAAVEPARGVRVSPRPERADSLRCVSSGYLEHGCSCTKSVPSDIAGVAWERELACRGDRGDRFFRFAWRGEVWLAYGLSDGCVRGVYCPAHSAQREERAFAAGLHVGG